MLEVTVITQNELFVALYVRGCAHVMLHWGIRVAPMGVCVCMETPIRRRERDTLRREKLRLIKHHPLAYICAHKYPHSPKVKALARLKSTKMKPVPLLFLIERAFSI